MYMIKKIRFFNIIVGLLICFPVCLRAEVFSFTVLNNIVQQDSTNIEIDDLKSERVLDSLIYLKRLKSIKIKQSNVLDVEAVSKSPFISVQQLLKGNVSGVHIQENSGEPGTKQNIVIRGITTPMFSNKDVVTNQPVVYVNGIPLINDNSFAYNIQQYDFNKIGPNSNLLAGINIKNIESITVVKDPTELAKLGPLAANGAIMVKLKDAKGMHHREITVNSYIGFAQAKKVSTTNAAYERSFRDQFYEAYSVPEDQRDFPNYLEDTSNSAYFGASKWSDLYYKTETLYNVNFAIANGSDKANFRFVLGSTSDASGADNASYNKSNVALFINMKPFDNFKFSSMFSGVRAMRSRNKNLRDRFAETEYISDLSTPISPSKERYSSFLKEYDKSIDDNINNIVRGYISGDLAITNKMNFITKLSFDYNEGIRDVFYPSTLMSTVNYISNYFEYNQRFVWSNNFDYRFNIGANNTLKIGALASIQSDASRYNYAKAYNGPNDYVKSTGNSSDFSNFRYTDRQKLNLMSSAVTLDYSYKEMFKAGAVLRYDGASSFQPNNRWLLTHSLFVETGLIKPSLEGPSFKVRMSSARVGKLLTNDRISSGPQYAVDFGWDNQINVPSYNGVSGVSRPYTSGWIGYNVDWPYSDKLDIAFTGLFFKEKLKTSLSFYTNKDHNMLIPVSVPSEYGYTSELKGGMEVSNKGLNFNMNADLLSNKNFNWNFSLNLGYNKNELTALPNGLDELIVGDRKLEVGKAIDQFWVYKNEGYYDTSGSVLTFNGVEFNEGDVAWEDIDNNGIINSKDKVLKGNSMPVVTGGFTNNFNYKNWDLSFNFVFALGHEGINQRDAQKYDFVNFDTQNTINSVSEIFFWQKNDNQKSYPIYNPLSQIQNYRTDQDLFLESLSYLKLRSLSLGYNFKMGKKQTGYVYANATNLLTFTDFSGEDPELVGFNGYYTGYSMPLARTISLGVKLNF